MVLLDLVPDIDEMTPDEFPVVMGRSRVQKGNASDKSARRMHHRDDPGVPARVQVVPMGTCQGPALEQHQPLLSELAADSTWVNYLDGSLDGLAAQNYKRE